MFQTARVRTMAQKPAVATTVSSGTNLLASETARQYRVPLARTLALVSVNAFQE